MTYIPPPQNYIQLNEDGYLVIDSCQTISPVVNRGIQFNVGGVPQLYLSPKNTIAGRGTGILGVDVNGGIFWTTVSSSGGGFSAGGDLSGTQTLQEVIGIQNHTLPSLSTGYLNYTGSAFAYTALPTSLPPNGTAGGDLGGSYPNPTVLSVAHVTTGTLPAANQAAQTMSGAVTGTTAASTIVSLPVGSLAPGSLSQFLITENSGGLTPAWVTMSGDVKLSSLGSTTVVGIDGYLISNTASNGQVLEFNGSTLAWTTISAGGTITLTGDTTGSGTTSITTTTGKINGTSVPAGGSLTAGNQLIVSGSSALSYSALNLAGGANYVTGVLPAGNMAPVNLAGGSSSVTGLLPVADLAVGSAAQILMNSSPPAPTWTTVSQDGYLSPTGLLTITDAQSGDIVFGSGATRGQISVASALTHAGLTQALISTNSATGSNMNISAQNATGTTSIGGNVIITPGTGTSTNGSTKIVSLNSTTNANIVFAPAQGTPVSQAGQIVHYTGYCTVLDNTVTVLTIPLPTSNTSVSVSCQGIWRITTATGIGTGGTQMILTYAKNLSGTVTTGSGTISSNIAGPDGDTTVLSEVTFGTAISGTNLLIQLISSTATTSFACTVHATAIFS